MSNRASISHAPAWASLTKAAEHFGIGRATLRRKIERGEVYAERIGSRRIRVDLNSLQVDVLGPNGYEA